MGGYSITSIPNKLPYLDLAIQSSRHPVAQWATQQAVAGDEVNVRVGGSFTYTADGHDDEKINTTSDEPAMKMRTRNRLLFIAGGVGINPLFSMIQQWNVDRGLHRDDRAVLLYSGRCREDLLFVRELNDMMDEFFRVVFTTTTDVKSSVLENDSLDTTNEKIMNNIRLKRGRVDRDMIKDAVRWLNTTVEVTDDQQEDEGDDDMIADLVYICGPPGMPEDMRRLLLPLGDDDDKQEFVRSIEDVLFEKWW